MYAKVSFLRMQHMERWKTILSLEGKILLTLAMMRFVLIIIKYNQCP